MSNVLIVFAYDLEEENIFQNLKVWSPDPVKIVYSSGDFAKYNTRYEWPCKVAIFCIFLTFQIAIEFNEYPWVEMS